MTLEASPLSLELRQIAQSLKESDAVPLFGSPPPFPKEAFETALSKALGIDHLSLTISSPIWKKAGEEDLGFTRSKRFYIELTPLEGFLTLFFPEEATGPLLFSLLKTEEAKHSLEEAGLIEEFFTFCLVEGFVAFQSIPFDKALLPHLIEAPKEPSSSFLVFDLEIHVGEGGVFPARVALSVEFVRAFRARYNKPPSLFSNGEAQGIPLTVSLVSGQTSLSKPLWDSLHPGDLLLLDSCSYEPDSDQTRVILTVDGIPLFRGKIKNGSLKILEYPLLQEVYTPMAKQDESFDEEFDDEEEEIENSTLEEDEEDFEEEESLPDEEETEDEAHLKKQEKEVREEPAKTPLAKLEEVPLTISVEIGRLKMSLLELSELKPGNMIEVSLHPEHGVDLVVSGKVVARGELLKIGEAIGVRVLEKG